MKRRQFLGALTTTGVAAATPSLLGAAPLPEVIEEDTEPCQRVVLQGTLDLIKRVKGEGPEERRHTLEFAWPDGFPGSMYWSNLQGLLERHIDMGEGDIPIAWMFYGLTYLPYAGKTVQLTDGLVLGPEVEYFLYAFPEDPTIWVSIGRLWRTADTAKVVWPTSSAWWPAHPEQHHYMNERLLDIRRDIGERPHYENLRSLG